MNNMISAMSSAGYRHVAKPLLFMRPPDTVHANMLQIAHHVQRHPALLHVLHKSWAYENPHFLSQNYHGITFRNPVGLSAGFDKNFELVPLIKAIGFGFMEGGSVTYYPCAGNPKPWFYRLPASKSLVVHAGLGNNGVVASINRLNGYSRHLFDDFPLNVSVAKTNSPSAATDQQAIKDYVGSLHLMHSQQLASMFTINISCPNTYGGEPFTTPKRLDALLERVDTLHISQPVFVKMPSDMPWSKFKQLLAVIADHDVAGVTICNLAKSRERARLKDDLPDYIPGGLSGKPTWDLSNNLIRETYRAYGARFTIIGVGGIFSAQDAYTKITLGASLVELITGMIFEGPQLIGAINRGLVDLLAADGYHNISEAIGTKA